MRVELDCYVEKSAVTKCNEISDWLEDAAAIVQRVYLTANGKLR